MKKIIAVTLLLVTVLLAPCTAEEYDIWGVWNYGRREEATRIANISTSIFSRDVGGRYLIFRPADDSAASQINYEGGGYLINEIIFNEQNRNMVSFYVEINLSTYLTGFGFLGEPERGKINMHFIDNDHMWVEIDYNDRNYPTTPGFPTGDFPGEKVVFRRGEYLGEYRESK
jgi:hypothetical protein